MGKTIEAFAVYHMSKESLSEHLQVSTAGLYMLRRNINVPNASAVLGSLVDSCGIRHWGEGKNFKNAANKVDAGLNSLADHGIIQHVSAFDQFTRSTILDVCRFSLSARQKYPKLCHNHNLLRLSSANRWVSDHCCNDIVEKIGNMSNRLDALNEYIGWSPSKKLKKSLTLFDFIRSIRNRIAHNGGIIGSDLAEMAKSELTLAALQAFGNDYAKGPLPEFPIFKRGQQIKLETKHAIFFGAVLYEIAKEINSHSVKLFNDYEFIDMAFYYSCIVDEHPFRTIRHRNAESRISYFLTNRYWRERTSPSPKNIIKRLTSLKTKKEMAPKENTTYWKIALERHESILRK